MEYVPAERKTVWPEGQEDMAELIWAAVAPELSVV